MVFGLIGSIFGASSQRKSTRATNLAMLRATDRTNWHNAQINKRTLAWDRDKTNITVRENRRAQGLTIAEARRAQQISVREARRAQQMTLAEARRAEAVSIAENRRAQRLSQESDNTRIQRTVKDALKAGINPLTALGTSGASSQSFGAPVFQGAALSGAAVGGASVGGVSLPGAPGQIGAVAPPPLSVDRSGEILGEGIKTFFNQIDPMDRERERLEIGLMRQELADRQKESAVVRDRNFGYSIPHVTTYSGTDYSVHSESVRGGIPDRDALRVAGTPVKKDPRFSDAEDVEQRYGDVVSSVYGATVVAADFMNTKRPIQQAWDEIKNPAPRSVAAKVKNWWYGRPSGPRPRRPKPRPTYGNPEVYSWFN